MAKKLTDAQRMILAAAAARENLRTLPVPVLLKADTATIEKALRQLKAAGLLAEIAAEAGDALWQDSENSERVTLIVTPAGLAAIGVVDEPAAMPTKRRGAHKPRPDRAKAALRAKTAPRATTSRTGGTQSKQDVVIALLRRQQGASVPEMMEATNWQAHSVRGFLSGALKRRLKLAVVSEKDKGGERRYHIAAWKPHES